MLLFSIKNFIQIIVIYLDSNSSLFTIKIMKNQQLKTPYTIHTKHIT